MRRIEISTVATSLSELCVDFSVHCSQEIAWSITSSNSNVHNRKERKVFPRGFMQVSPQVLLTRLGQMPMPKCEKVEKMKAGSFSLYNGREVLIAVKRRLGLAVGETINSVSQSSCEG